MRTVCGNGRGLAMSIVQHYGGEIKQSHHRETFELLLSPLLGLVISGSTVGHFEIAIAIFAQKTLAAVYPLD